MAEKRADPHEQAAAPAGISPAGAGAIAVTGEGDPADGPCPDVVLELAAACVRFVTAKLKVEPDFEPETLPVIDHYLLEARSAIGERPEALPLTTHAVGAYFGEVVRRRHRCWWRIDQDDPGAWRLEFRDLFLSFYPVQVIHNALTRDEERDFPGFELQAEDRDFVLPRLQELPPVPEDDYYATSSRLEVLDIVVEALRSRGLIDRYSRRAFRPEDYE